VCWGIRKVCRKASAWFWGTVAATTQILVGFFPTILAASIGLPTPTIWFFLIAFTLWFGMLFISGVDQKIIALAFITGGAGKYEGASGSAIVTLSSWGVTSVLSAEIGEITGTIEMP
jgi:hypothetical protein